MKGAVLRSNIFRALCHNTCILLFFSDMCACETERLLVKFIAEGIINFGCCEMCRFCLFCANMFYIFKGAMQASMY